MKKVFLSLALLATLIIVSCKESTQDKVEEATEAVGNDIQEATEEAVETIDSTATEVGNDIEEGVEDIKDDMK